MSDLTFSESKMRVVEVKEQGFSSYPFNVLGYPVPISDAVRGLFDRRPVWQEGA